VREQEDFPNTTFLSQNMCVSRITQWHSAPDRQNELAIAKIIGELAHFGRIRLRKDTRYLHSRILRRRGHRQYRGVAKGTALLYLGDQLRGNFAANGSYAASTPIKHFVYDTATVNGSVMSYAKGQVAEAYTCSGACATKITDEGFSYSQRGELTDVYESTPNSNGYYHTTTGYYANGALNTLTGVPLHTAGWTFGIDGEGRPKTAIDGASTNLVTGTSYNPAGQPTSVALGSGDRDAYGYDPNTGRMSSYQFAVGATPKYETGTLNWNPNGTLGSLAVTDQPYTADAQSCTYGYDDLARLKNASCGTAWSQTFTYDPFGNIVKAGSSAFQATYSAATNRIATITGAPAPTYDANGNLLTITDSAAHSYSWDAEGKPASLDTVGLTYDALGRMVEQNRAGVFTEILYSPIGKLGLMNKQITENIFLPLPGGEEATYTSQTIRYRHYDWLGSARFESNTGQQKYGDVAYAPFGESYDMSGTPYLSFTGQQQDTVSGLFDFAYREYNPIEGRWISPDPAGAGASDPATPQSWNRYAYVLNNPLSNTDPTGLWCYYGTTDDNGKIDFTLPDASDWNSFDYNSTKGECSNTGGQWYDDANPPLIADPTVVNVAGIAPLDVATTSAAPSKVGCGTVLPNGQTVGSVVQQQRANLQNAFNESVAQAQTGRPSNPFAYQLGAFTAIVGPNGPIDFKKGQTGQTFVQMGLAGNFAYYAIGAGYFSPSRLDAGAGAYALTAAAFFPHSTVHFSDLTGNFFSDSAAGQMRGPGLAANGCSIP
jgi:RHS repeat-associated protein